MLLCADTSSTQVTVALGDTRAFLGGMVLARPRHHAELLVPAIQQLMNALKVEVPDVAGVSVTVGPGLFAGLRVGIATLSAFAQARDLPVIGLSSLEVLAEGAPLLNGPIAATIDARRGEVYWARFERTAGELIRLTPDRVDPPEVVLAECAGDVIVGEGLSSQDGREAADWDEPERLVGGSITAEALWAASARSATLGQAVSAGDITPVYLRKTDAELNWERRRAMDMA